MIWACPALAVAAFSLGDGETPRRLNVTNHTAVRKLGVRRGFVDGIRERQIARTLHSVSSLSVGSKRQGEEVDAPHEWKK
jgi:hypothetical protein